MKYYNLLKLDISLIGNWRSNWKSSLGKALSIGNSAHTVNGAIDMAIDKAHAPSVGRALKLKSKSTKQPRLLCKQFLAAEIISNLYGHNITQAYYDNWMDGALDIIKGYYNSNGITNYTYGNAQKLINMTIKFLLSADIINANDDLFKVAHIPIDRGIMKKAKRMFSIKPLPMAWSKCNTKQLIVNYQLAIRKEVNNTSWIYPLFWECDNW